MDMMTSNDMLPNEAKTLVVYYDLELCDGSITSEIYQIGAKTVNSEFSTFILPTGNIDWGVTKYAGGIKIQKSTDGQRQLMKSSTALNSVNADDGINSFIDWVKMNKTEGDYEKVFLIAHGSSDMPALFNNISRSGLAKEFMEVVTHFVDSLKYFESNFPDWKKYSISFLYEKMFNHTKTDVHDALEDAKALYDLMKESKKDDNQFFADISKISVDIKEAYLQSARKVMKSMRKRKNKSHMSTNLKKFCAFPSEVLDKIKEEQSEKIKQHPVNALLELCVKRKLKTPQFSVISEMNSSNEKHYIGKVVVSDITYQSSQPRNKKNKAKSDVAEIAIKAIVESDNS